MFFTPGPYAVHGVLEYGYADFHVVLEADEPHVLRLLAVVAFSVPLAAVILSDGGGKRDNPRLSPLTARDVRKNVLDSLIFPSPGIPAP